MQISLKVMSYTHNSVSWSRLSQLLHVTELEMSDLPSFYPASLSYSWSHIRPQL